MQKLNQCRVHERIPAADVLTAGYHREFIDDLDRCEYLVPVEWVATIGLDAAIQEVGMFGNQNSVCAPKTPKWRHTVDRLKTLFPAWEKTNLNSAR